MFKYCIVGIEDQTIDSIASQLSNTLKYELIGTSKDPQKLLDIILAGAPHVIFINVDNYKAADYSCLTQTITDLYRSFANKPSLIALSNSEKQAYDCIKNGFLDYLTYPIEEIQLQKLEYKLKTSPLSIEENPQKLCLQTYSDFKFIDLKDIIFLKADNNSTEVYMLDNSKIVAYKTLKYFEAILPSMFKRIHQSFIINQNYISRIHLGKSECHLKSLKIRLPFSKSYRNVMADLATSLSVNSFT